MRTWRELEELADAMGTAGDEPRTETKFLLSARPRAQETQTKDSGFTNTHLNYCSITSTYGLKSSAVRTAEARFAEREQTRRSSSHRAPLLDTFKDLLDVYSQLQLTP